MKKMNDEAVKGLLQTLKNRFDQNKERHPNLNWSDVEKRLLSNPDQFSALMAMENSGGEPDVVGYDTKTAKYLFVDCCKESPAGRRSLCYDQAALNSRKQNKPKGSAVDSAKAMGTRLLTEEEYRQLQNLGSFDTKTSSWIDTPEDIREKGGALFGDHRFGKVFIYHNGAESYYAARGFRTCMAV